MQSIGERLEEARKKKGISIREAADATKIRGDFLDCFEKDKFDIGIPDIYTRGFLNNYSKFLHIDPTKIVTDYNSFKLGRSKIAKRDHGDGFGRLDLPDQAANPPIESESESQENQQGLGSFQSGPSTHIANEPESDIDYTLYWKLGGIAVAVILVFVLVIFGVYSVISNDNDTTDNYTTTETVNPVETTGAAGIEAVEEVITLIGKGTVTVMVINKVTQERLFKETLSDGDRRDIIKSGPISIVFSSGANFSYEQGGQLFSPSTEGTGRITVN